VVNRKGVLTGKIYFGGSTMEDLLKSEGILITNNQIENFDKVFWDPAMELL
jgi:methylated-DNA-protein-cysteine methyltransferase-like protein